MPIKKMDGELVKPCWLHYNLNGYGGCDLKMQRDVIESHPTI